MTEKQDNWQYAEDHFGAVQTALAETDLVVSPDQVYKGPGIAKLFQTSEDIGQMRVGRKHWAGHWSFKFNTSGKRLPFFSDDYSVFIPLTKENIDAIRNGELFQFTVAKNIREDDEGFIRSVDPTEFTSHEGYPGTLLQLLPRRKIPGVSSTDVKIGNSVTQGVKSSNPDDDGEVMIESLSGNSAVLYNPTKEKPPRPHFREGGNGWYKPLEVMVKGDELFFDTREQPEGKLYLLKFQKDGYDPIEL
jgi:hypothetical protein